MSGSGGGGQSGKVEYPPHITEKHQTWLNIIGDPIASNPTSPLGVYGSPGSAPATTALTEAAAMTAITALETRLGARETAIEAIDIGALLDETLLEDVYDLVVAFNAAMGLPTIPQPTWSFTDTDLAAGVTSMDARVAALNDLDDLEGIVDLETVVYPRYEAGMRDINAVNSSAFVLGRSVMEATYQAKIQEVKHNLIGQAENTRAGLRQARGQIQADSAKAAQQFIHDVELARFDGAFKYYDLSLGVLKLMGELGRLRGMEEAKFKFEAQRMLQEMLLQVEAMHDALLAKNLELRRMRVVSEFELAGFKADLSIKHARWEMDNWQYFGNLMAAPGGGHGMAGDKMPSKMTSALGGGLSGAAAGAQIGGGWGALAGGVIGAGASLMQ